MANIGNVLKIGGSILAGLGGAASVAVTVPTVVQNMQQQTAETTTVDNVVENYEINNTHTITVTDTYTINGEEVTEAEFMAYLANGGYTVTVPATTTETLVINSRSFDTDGIARLADFIDFEFYNGQCYAAKIISDKVVGVEYDYSYIQDGMDYFAETGNNLIYQDTTSGIYGMTFTVGSPTEEYSVLTNINAAMFNADTLNEYYIFYFDDSNTNTRPLQFYEVFDSITLTIAR